MQEIAMEQAVTVGEEDFKTLIDQDVAYIDKTGSIEKFFVSPKENGKRTGSSLTSAKVTLITRPRRFGKTLTLSMLKYFLEMNYQNLGDKSEAEKLFKGLVISKKRKFCQRYMSEYPVILISLKGVDGETFSKALGRLLSKIANLYSYFEFLLDSDALNEREKNNFNSALNFAYSDDVKLRDPDNEDRATRIITNSLERLTSLLQKVFKRKSIILIDEYDVPLQKAQVNGYYNQMLKVIRGLFENALKTNINLEKGFLVGSLPIHNESVFTGLNHLEINNITSQDLSDFIGFTRGEVHKLLQQCNLGSYEDEVVRWYDGYKFGNTEIFCPWSVINFCKNGINRLKKNEKIIPENYWANSSGNDIIEMCIQSIGADDSQRLQNLLDGKAEVIKSSEFTTYPDLKKSNNFEVALNLMLHTGYLTEDHIPEKGKLAVKIPNQEILECFENKVKRIFSKKNSEWLNKAVQLREAFFARKPEVAQTIMIDMLRNFISIRNTAQESYYHAFLSGVLAIASGSGYNLLSDMESGDGYADLRIENIANWTVVIIECKKTGADENPLLLCRKALEQIDNKHYAQSYEDKGFTVYKYGISFTGKSCRVATDQA